MSLECTAVMLASDLDAIPTGAWLAIVGIAVAFLVIAFWLYGLERKETKR